MPALFAFAELTLARWPAGDLPARRDRTTVTASRVRMTASEVRGPISNQCAESILRAAKARTAGQAVVEEAELGEHGEQEEVERAQAHDGHDVRGVGEEGMAGDGEDGGDGVEREDDVGEFDGERARKRTVIMRRPSSRTKKLVLTQADGMDAGEPGDPAGGVRLGLLGSEGRTRRMAAMSRMAAKT